MVTLKIAHWTATCQAFPAGRQAKPLYDPNTWTAEGYSASWRLCLLCCPDVLPEVLGSRGIEAGTYAVCQRRFCIPCRMMRNVEKPAYRRLYCPNSGEIEPMCNRCAADYAADHLAKQDHYSAMREVKRLRGKLWELGVDPDA